MDELLRSHEELPEFVGNANGRRKSVPREQIQPLTTGREPPEEQSTGWKASDEKQYGMLRKH
jgi:hypothetical protein